MSPTQNSFVTYYKSCLGLNNLSKPYKDPAIYGQTRWDIQVVLTRAPLTWSHHTRAPTWTPVLIVGKEINLPHLLPSLIAPRGSITVLNVAMPRWTFPYGYCSVRVGVAVLLCVFFSFFGTRLILLFMEGTLDSKIKMDGIRISFSQAKNLGGTSL